MALLFAAQHLKSGRIVVGALPRISADEQGRLVGDAWEQLAPPRPALSLDIVDGKSGEVHSFALGPHPPRLWPQDIDLVHRLWQDLSEKSGVGGRLHHRDVVSLALRRLDTELHSGEGDKLIAEVKRELG